MKNTNIIYKRKGSNVIYPYTEENSNNADLIPMTVEEAIEDGLLDGPKSEEIDVEKQAMSAEIEELRTQLAHMQELQAQYQKNQVESESEQSESKPSDVEEEHVELDVKPSVTIEDDEVAEVPDDNEELDVDLSLFEQMGIDVEE